MSIISTGRKLSEPAGRYQPRYSGNYHDIDKIMTAVTSEARAELNDYCQVVASGTPLNMVELFKQINGKALTTIKRKPDGRVTVTGFLFPNSDTPAKILQGSREQMIRVTTAGILQETIKRAGTQVRSAMILDSEYNQQVGTRARREAEEAVNAISTTIHTPDGEREVSKIDSGNAVNNLVYRQIIDHEWLKTIKGIYSDNRSDQALTFYNATIKNRIAVNQVNQDQPNVAKYYITFLARERCKMRARETPEKITRAVREDTGLNGYAWRLFTKYGTPWINGITHESRKNQEERSSLLTDLYGTLAAVNAGNITSEKTHHVYRTAITSANCRENSWTQGDPEKARLHVIKEFVKTPGTPENSYQLHTVIDALEWYIENDLPWRQTNWDAYLRRSKQWHAMILEVRDEEQTEQLRNQQWNSLVKNHTRRDLEARAVDNGYDLMLAGKRLHNCIASYTKKCAAGNSRIFLIIRKGKDEIGAAELTRPAGRKRWSRGQVQIRGQKKPGEAAIRLVEEICAKYNEAESAVTEKTEG